MLGLVAEPTVDHDKQQACDQLGSPSVVRAQRTHNRTPQPTAPDAYVSWAGERERVGPKGHFSKWTWARTRQTLLLSSRSQGSLPA